MRILITTGIYPPKIGGPAEYSKNLKIALEKAQNRVKIGTFGLEEHLPTGIRHGYFFFKILPKVLWSDLSISMDTFSVAFPTVFASKIFGKKTIIRTGGDFLWEQYIERTGKKVLFRNFYNEEINNFTNKEKIIFNLTKWTLRNSTYIVFSTEWQRSIFIDAYGLDKNKTSIIENYYGKKESNFNFDSKTFIASGRNLALKNFVLLEEIFNEIKLEHSDVFLYSKNDNYETFMNKIAHSYAVVSISISEISPNLILDAIRMNKPFICTKEVGIYDRIKDVGIFVDPLNEEEIEKAVLQLLEVGEYQKARQKVRDFSFVHTWEEIAQEFLNISNLIK